jgi:hypothetical protein
LKFLKRLLITSLAILIIWYFFGPSVYRWSVSYVAMEERTGHKATAPALIVYINEEASEKTEEIKEIVRQSLKLTSDKLSFTLEACPRDPNLLIETKEAHCIGYARFTATVCNHLLEKNKLSGEWKARSVQGQLYLFGYNLHSMFSNPFFRDHDFVIIENSKTKDAYYVDPTASDYLGVDFVTLRK